MRIGIVTTIIFILVHSYQVFAQNNLIAPARIPLSEVPQLVMPTLDNEALYEQEMEARVPGRAPHFAHVFDVDISPQTHGVWEDIGGGMSLWRLRMFSANAYSLNLGFSSFIMPHGASLIMYSPNKKDVMGPFTPADNEEHEQLWTPVLDGEELIVEVQIPTSEIPNMSLKITSINHDFIGFTSVLSGSCNLDVICGEADGWGIVDGYRDIIQSVAVYGTNGSTFCTGFLVNNTAEDCRPFFMTADHCIDPNEAPSVVVYWNYFNSTCREPNSGASGNIGDGNLSDFNTGAIFRAEYNPSDMYLMELDDEVSETANAFFAGWSAEPTLVMDTVIAVHHPNTDEKRISFDFDAPAITEYFDTNVDADYDHVWVDDWDIGTTEPGSSGSPLFDKHKRVIGQLHGGGAACGNDDSDWYGWVHTSWEGGGTPATSLKTWLDPIDTGVLTLDGRTQVSCGFVVEVVSTVNEVCIPDNLSFDLEVSPNFESEVTITITGAPAGADFSWMTTTADAGDILTLDLENTTDLGSGTFDLNFLATDGTNSFEGDISFTIVDGLPSTDIVFPMNNAIDVNTLVTYQWDNLNYGNTWDFELASDASFSNTILTQSDITQTAFMAPFALNPLTTYYWRVKASNICGEGEWVVASFTTANISCDLVGATDLPLEIDDNDPWVIESIINISQPGLVSSIAISELQITHSWVGDLVAELISPQGTIIQLFDRPGTDGSGYGCGEDNIFVSFSDQATNTAADFEDSCSGTGNAVSGEYQSIDALSALIGEEAMGDWVLRISDEESDDGGELVNWELNICQQSPDAVAIYLPQDNWNICANDSLTFEVMIGSGFDGDVILSANNLPTGVEFLSTPNPVVAGNSAMVQFINWGSLSGDYTVEIEATDGIQTATYEIAVNVDVLLNNEVEIIAPISNTYWDSGNTLNIEWNALAGAEEYNLVVWENGLEVANEMVTGVSYSFNNFNPNSEYSIGVIAMNTCSSSSMSSVEIATYGVLGASPDESAICRIDTAYFTATIPEGMESPIDLSISATDMALQYVITPSSFVAGDQITIKCFDLIGASSSNIDVEISVSDANYSDTDIVAIELIETPTLANLTTPMDESAFSSSVISFSWTPSINADEYIIEISDDATFSTVLETINVATISYDWDSGLSDGVYYWRVTGKNDCGGATTGIFTFTITPVSVEDFVEENLTIYPNPVMDNLWIDLAITPPVDIRVDILDIIGREIMNDVIPIGQNQYVANLEDLAEGVYILRLSWDNSDIVKRIIVQH